MIDALLWHGAEVLLWAESNTLVAATIAAVLLVPGGLCCWAARQGAVVSRKSMTQVEERLARISTALELLTDTTESALGTAFNEIGRLSQGHGADADDRGLLPARVQMAARNGRTAREIAQAEGISEGEVRLRLRLHGEAPLPS